MSQEKKEKPRKGMSLLAKVTAGNVLLLVLVLVLTLMVTLRYSIQHMEHKMEEILLSTSAFLAGSPQVIKVLEARSPDPELNAMLDLMIEQTTDLDVITVADETGRRVYHINKSRIGEVFVGGDEDRALRGEQYLSNAVGTLGLQRRAFSPVYGQDGSIIGFVMASALMNRIQTMRGEVIRLYMDMAIIIFFVGFTISTVLTENIKTSLLGYEPSQFTRIFLEQEEVLRALEEGIISVNPQGEILLVNDSAVQLLGVSSRDIIGKNIGQVFPSLHLDEVLRSGTPQYNKSVDIPELTLLCDRIPILRGGRTIGAVTIMRNRTEATRLAEQLTGSKHIITALRANTHEFMNKLHVILGLLQMGQIQNARRYIEDVAAIQSETIAPVLRCIQNPTLAALVLGKISHMRELDIALTLLPNSRLPRHSSYLSTRALVTVVGNLLDNSIEAINEWDNRECMRKITLQITENQQGLFISLDDTGQGMTSDEQAKLFMPGYSTKGEGRGTGLGLIKSILDISGGTAQIESEPEVGTSITLSFTRQRAAAWGNRPASPPES